LAASDPDAVNDIHSIIDSQYYYISLQHRWFTSIVETHFINYDALALPLIYH